MRPNTSHIYFPVNYLMEFHQTWIFLIHFYTVNSIQCIHLVRLKFLRPKTSDKARSTCTCVIRGFSADYVAWTVYGNMNKIHCSSRTDFAKDDRIMRALFSTEKKNKKKTCEQNNISVHPFLFPYKLLYWE